MASPAFWMLRPKQKTKNKKTLESPLSVSHAPLSHLSGNSVDATFKTPPKFSSFPLCHLLPWTRPPAAPPGYSQPSTTASLSPLSTQSSSPGDTPFMSLLCSKPASHLIHGKSQSPHGGLLICSSFEHHFSIFSLTLFQLHLPPGYSLNMPGKLPLPPLVWTVPVVRMVCPYSLYRYLFYSIQASNQIAPSS